MKTTSALLKKYRRYESINSHNNAAKLLVDNFGTEEEKEIMKQIIERYNKIGYITNEDRELRYSISQKYYKLIV